MKLDLPGMAHLNSITHDGKVLVFGTTSEGKVHYTVKQQGFEDSYLRTKEARRTGWETWRELTFPDETPADASVVEREKKENTRESDPDRYLLKSCYTSRGRTAVAPVQLVSGNGHIYVFRQSREGTLLVDRFVLDGMNNKLNPKLEVRYKRSKQKYEPQTASKGGDNTFKNYDSLDFMDTSGNNFYEPTRELFLVNNLKDGWFSVVRVPTREKDCRRWHIFSYNSSTSKVDVTTLRFSDEDIFTLKDYTLIESDKKKSLAPRTIPGIIRRTLSLDSLVISGGPAAATYNLQQEQKTPSGSQLIKTATKVMLAIPTKTGTAAIGFSVAGDGTLSRIDETPDASVARGQVRDLLLPPGDLDDIKIIGDATPTPRGAITGLKAGTAAENAEDMVKVKSDVATGLQNGDRVTITNTREHNGLYEASRIDDDTLSVAVSDKVLGHWEKEEKEEGGLVYNGIITGYELLPDGKLKIHAPGHGLVDGDEVQVVGTKPYNNSHPVTKIDDTHFVIIRKWISGEAVNVKLKSRKRRGIVFNGNDDIALKNLFYSAKGAVSDISLEAWIKTSGNGAIISWDKKHYMALEVDASGKVVWTTVDKNGAADRLTGAITVNDDAWHYVSAIFEGASGAKRIYIDGALDVEKKLTPDMALGTGQTRHGFIGAGSEADRFNGNRAAVGRFTGRIGELRIWDAARTADQVKNYMHLTLTGKEMDLAACLRMGAIAVEKDERLVYDFSIHGRHGVVSDGAHVGAALLNRNLTDGKPAVKYGNGDLAAVSRRATYKEEFEFKVDADPAFTLEKLNDADGAGNKIFTISCWGKESRHSETKTEIAVVQEKFVDLGNGWFKAGCSFTIPDKGVAMIRSFEISNVRGAWKSLEIRKHRIRLASDSITEAVFTDRATLAALADNQSALAVKAAGLEDKESREAGLLKEKFELEKKIAQLKAHLADAARQQENIDAKKAEVAAQETKVESARTARDDALKNYENEKNNILNCWFKLKFITDEVGVPASFLGARIDEHIAFPTKFPDSDDHVIQWRRTGNSLIQNRKTERYLGNNGEELAWLYPSSSADVNQYKQTMVYKDGGCTITNMSNRSLMGSPDFHNAVYHHTMTPYRWEVVRTDAWNTEAIEAARLDSVKKNELFNQENKTLTRLKDELAALEKVASDPSGLTEIEERLKKVIQLLTSLQLEIATLHTDIVGAVKTNRQTPLDMPLVHTASQGSQKGLETRGALLGFSRPATRISAMETCDGHVSLSYFDNQGRMRRTLYDACADSRNTTYRQWLPDSLKTCPAFNQVSSKVVLANPIQLVEESDYSMEFWFQYPPPSISGAIYCSGDNGVSPFQITSDGKLGVHDGAAFHDSGYTPDRLAPGWRHAAVVASGKETTAKTVFYIDGREVASCKRKATGAIKRLGNGPAGGKMAGRMAEVRFWNTALSKEEVEANSKTLLTGNEPGLTAYYPMNEAGGDAVKDHSPGGNHGVLDGASWLACTAPIGRTGEPALQFDGSNDYVSAANSADNTMNTLHPAVFTVACWIKATGLHEKIRTIAATRCTAQWTGFRMFIGADGKLNLRAGDGTAEHTLTGPAISANSWIHLALVHDGAAYKLYVNGKAEASLAAGYKASTNTADRLSIGARLDASGKPIDCFNGRMAGFSLWGKALAGSEIERFRHRPPMAGEDKLIAHWPLGSAVKDPDPGEPVLTIHEAAAVTDYALPRELDALLVVEYSTVALDPATRKKKALMRRLLAAPGSTGARVFSDQRIENLELKWIGNAQFAPTLLGYIEGPPPAPSENLTEAKSYNGATSVALGVSEDVQYSWNRSQQAGLGASLNMFLGASGQTLVGIGAMQEATEFRAGLKGTFSFDYQFLNTSNITTSSSLRMTDSLKLRGAREQTPRFPHLGKRYVPKNVGYALVISGMADLYIARLARTGAMVSYEMRPVDGVPPDVNTITFLINPAYTMNGSLDGLVGSRPADPRFYKQVPDMRAQYGALYPSSYYRLKEAYALKEAIEKEDKRRASYFAQFNARLVDEASLNREIGDSREVPVTVPSSSDGASQPEGGSTSTEGEKTDATTKKVGDAKEKQDAAVNKKRAEIDSQISDQEKRTNAAACFAGWQRKMEDLQIRAGKRNIVNTYIWDADGGLRTEAQNFASAAEHTMGGSFSMNASLGFEGQFAFFGAGVELTALATINLTQTMTKTQATSKGINLNVDLGGVECDGVTDHKDYPLKPGEKVDRYRFMSFYLEGSNQNYNDFFNTVVDPEWLRSNDEEARALRQAIGRPNKVWRVLHRVTYVERPALMGFGRDVRKTGDLDQATREILDYFTGLNERHHELKVKLDEVLNVVKAK